MIYTTEQLNELFTSLLKEWQKSSDRFIENEQFLCQYLKLPWYKRALFGRRIILKHMKNILEKYAN